MALNISQVAPPAFEPLLLTQAKLQCAVDPGSSEEDPLFEIYIASAREVAEQFTRRAFFNQTWQRTLDNFPLAASFDYAPSPADKWNWPVYGGMWNRLAIDLPLGRALAINSITYADVCLGPTTLAPSLYAADLSGIPCRLTPSQSAVGGLVWPWQGSYMPGSVNIQWVAGNFVLAVSESFMAPAESPYQYTLLKKSVTGIQSVQASAGTAVAGWTAPSGTLCGATTLTLPEAQAGQQLTVNYYVSACPAAVLEAMLLLIGHSYRNREATTDIGLVDLVQGVKSKLSPYVVEWTDYRPC